MQCWKNHGVSVHVRRTFIDLICDDEAPDNQLSKSANGLISSCPDQSFTPWYGSESASETGSGFSRVQREDSGIADQDAHVVVEAPSVAVRVVNTFIVVALNGPGEDFQSLNAARRRAVRSCPNFEFEEPEPEVSPMQQAASTKPVLGLRPTSASGLASEGAPILEDPACFRQIQKWACSTPTSDTPMHSTPLSPTFGVPNRVDHQHKRVSSRELNLLHMLLENPDCFQTEEWACSTQHSDVAVQSGPLSSTIGPQSRVEHQHKTAINHELSLLHVLMEDQNAFDRGVQSLANDYRRHGGADASFISSNSVGLPLLAVRAKSISECNALDERDFDAVTCIDSFHRSRSEPQHDDEPPFLIPPGEPAAVTLSVMRDARMRMHAGDGEGGKGLTGQDEPAPRHGVQDAPLPGRGAGGKTCQVKAAPFDGVQGEATTFVEALRRSRALKRQQLAEGVEGEPTSAQDRESHPSSDRAPIQTVSLSSGSKRGGNGGRRGSSTKSRLWCHVFLDPCMLEDGFDLIKKIIGKNGRNTRDIYEATRAKVRVRGKGSGHIEGGREAPVPLMIAISGDDCCNTDFRTSFEKTCQLLAQVSRRFESHLRRRHVQRISFHPRSLRFWIGGLSEDAKACLGSMTDGLLAEAGPADRT